VDSAPVEPDAPPLVLNRDEVDTLLERLKAVLEPGDFALIAAIVRNYVDVSGLLEQRRVSLERLRRIIFGVTSEKTADLFAQAAAGTEGVADAAGSDTTPPSEPRRGHGRRGADAYRGAVQRRVPLADAFRPGACCPDCRKGKLYANVEPRRLVRVTGQAPLMATVYELERVRCNLCGHTQTAASPPGVGDAKYDAKAGAVVALLKYGTGMPFNRLAGLQASFGLPLPASTQWDIVHDAAQTLVPVHDELARQAAAGDVLHQDDTTMKVLSPKAEPAAEEQEAPSDGAAPARPRTGSYTTGIVSRCEADGHDRVLYVTGPRHAGENLRALLQRRPPEAEPPIQMCDALVANMPADLRTVVGNCLAHGRRQFVDVAAHFPAECRHVLDELGAVYRVDAEARRQGLSSTARLTLHQTRSRPVLDALHLWLQAQFDERRTEPNSGLGQAINYLLKRWDRFTLFLRQAGAPLDNNLCECVAQRKCFRRA
jgi:transposase